MAEAVVVSVVVNQLISAAAEWLKEEISPLKGVKTKLDNMKNKMQTIQTVLEDAENQSVKKKNVKLWLKELKEVSYDMEDVLDEWSTRVHMLEREREEAEENITSSPSPTAAKFKFIFLQRLNSFSSVKQLPWRHDIALRIKDINRRIDLVFLEMKNFNLAIKAVGNDDAMNKIINDRITTSLFDETEVYGRGHDKSVLLTKVLSMNTEQEKSPQVISIVGSGGLRKTTLAQMVYNDRKVKEKFGENRIWVCVSDPFDEVKVAKYILEGLKVDHTKMTSLQTLYQSIVEKLSVVSFLLVLDNVWDETPNKWEKLKLCLRLSNPNSRILVTTRKGEVTSMMGTTPSHILKPRLISDLSCWVLMSQIVFQGRSDRGNDDLEAIGKKIAIKCKGLPLAAKTLGGMLKSKESVDKWNKILNSEIWELDQAHVELCPHIFLSYQELSAMLRRCFLILAIFPKDAKLKVKDVIGIWMAHGFLNPTEEDVMVSTGQKYLEFLVSRDEVSSISILDGIKNDSSQSKRGLCLKSTTARHLYIDGNIDPTGIGYVGKLCTCIIRNVAPNITSDLVKGLKMVRALYLEGCGLKEVPQSIGKLIHLRLLDLSDNPLLELPETVCGLYHLQELILEESAISTLPDSIGKLTNLIFLRHDVLEKYPESVGKLIKLHNLDRVKVEAGKSKLGFLKDLNQLRGKLEIVFISEYGDEDDVKKAEIQKKEHITELKLDFSDKEVTDGVIAALQPHSNIQELEIDDLLRSCISVPNWITSLHRLTYLRICRAPNCSTLPPPGELQSLQRLEMISLKVLKIIGREFGDT